MSWNVIGGITWEGGTGVIDRWINLLSMYFCWFKVLLENKGWKSAVSNTWKRGGAS